MKPDEMITVLGRSGIETIHFVGIGGAGMSPLARIMLTLGCGVTGSDLRRNQVIERLSTLGARITRVHRRDNLGEADLVVYSSAVRPDNPELSAARERGIPIIHRSGLLAGLMRLKKGIAVAGSHGKTSTAAMIAWILVKAGLRPGLALGGEVIGLEEDDGWSAGPWLIAEADESDGSLGRLNPAREVITGLDLDHVDYYPDWEKLIETFRRFVRRLSPDGILVINADTRDIDLLIEYPRKVVTYGLHPSARVRGIRVRADGIGSRFGVKRDGSELGEVTLSQLGVCNVENCLGAIALSLSVGVPFPDITRALSSYRGVRRRLEIRSAGPVMIVEDYAHHPVEVTAALKAVRSACPRRLWCVFQPHRYTRMRHFSRELAEALLPADRIIVTDLYPAFERPVDGVSSALLMEAFKELGRDGPLYLEPSSIRACLEREVEEGDAVVIMGAGDIGWLAGELVKHPLK